MITNILDRYYVPFLIGSMIVGGADLVYFTQEAKKLSESSMLNPDTFYSAEFNKKPAVSPQSSNITIEDKLK